MKFSSAIANPHAISWTFLAKNSVPILTVGKTLMAKHIILWTNTIHIQSDLKFSSIHRIALFNPSYLTCFLYTAFVVIVNRMVTLQMNTNSNLNFILPGSSMGNHMWEHPHVALNVSVDPCPSFGWDRVDQVSAWCLFASWV